MSRPTVLLVALALAGAAGCEAASSGSAEGSVAAADAAQPTASADTAAERALREAVVGRWDVQATGPQGPVPGWLELSRSGHRTLVGRIMHGVGSARPIARVDVAGGVLRFAVPPQWETPTDTTSLRAEMRLEGERLVGTLVTPTGERQPFTAVRAPSLRRAAAPQWGEPVQLFNGRDLAGWRVIQGENRWSVVDGVLTNRGGGGNLVSERTFDDFRLHAEFHYPAGSNSGVYLRGRYEVQIEDPGTRTELGPHDIGGVYGVVAPNANAARAPGEWQTYDITLVGRHVTIVLNGRTVVSEQVIAGPTGGALDADEGAPGPIMIQGDHGPVEFRAITITTARGARP